MQALHLLLQFRDLFFEPGRLALARLGRLLPVRAVKLLQITRDAPLDLRQAPLHLRPREVPVAIVHRFELAAINRDTGFSE